MVEIALKTAAEMAERPHKLRFRVLLARDLTAETATQLAELYVPQDPCFDLCLLCGPFTHKPLITRCGVRFARLPTLLRVELRL